MKISKNEYVEIRKIETNWKICLLALFRERLFCLNSAETKMKCVNSCFKGDNRDLSFYMTGINLNLQSNNYSQQIKTVKILKE